MNQEEIVLTEEELMVTQEELDSVNITDEELAGLEILRETLEKMEIEDAMGMTEEQFENAFKKLGLIKE